MDINLDDVYWKTDGMDHIMMYGKEQLARLVHWGPDRYSVRLPDKTMSQAVLTLDEARRKAETATFIWLDDLVKSNKAFQKDLK